MGRLLCLGLICELTFFLSISRQSSASVVLNETFDYANQAALDASWNALGSNTTYKLDTSFGNPSPSYDMPSPASNLATGTRLGKNIGVVNGTDANPLHLSFDLYLEAAGGPWINARDYVELRGYQNGALNDGALEALVAAGVYNNSDDTYNRNYYQGRVLPNPPEPPIPPALLTGWQTLDESAAPQRSTGWHNLDVEIRTSDILFFVDGNLSETEIRQGSAPFDSVVLGSGLTSGGHEAWIDNVKVFTDDINSGVVPEPLSLLVWIGLITATAIGRGRATRS